MDDIKKGDLVVVEGREGTFKVMNVTTSFLGLAEPDFEWSGKKDDASAQFAVPRDQVRIAPPQQFDISDTPASGATVKRMFG